MTIAVAPLSVPAPRRRLGAPGRPRPLGDLKGTAGGGGRPVFKRGNSAPRAAGHLCLGDLRAMADLNEGFRATYGGRGSPPGPRGRRVKVSGNFTVYSPWPPAETRWQPDGIGLLRRPCGAARCLVPVRAPHTLTSKKTLPKEGLESAPGRTRTCGQVLRRHLLYPLSYGGRAVDVDHGPRTRIEVRVPCPGCFTSVARCGGSVKRSKNRRQVRILHRFWHPTRRVLCTRYACVSIVAYASCATYPVL